MNDQKLSVEHEFGDKRIPSGFFDQPLAENVSAVIFSNAGTIANFDRMGGFARVAEPSVRYVRFGPRDNSDANASMGTPFSMTFRPLNMKNGGPTKFRSSIIRARRGALTSLPLGATHHYFQDDEFQSIAQEGSVLSSYTMLMGTRDNKGAI
ncbi:hypothetical protein [Novosphingobium sp. P6W]|uniref:hypothetical protein n=1 Tax=Novosphingobium sp. P6W TaxID=1609758 RepID=UPI0005C2DC01|nr:hypothetical protein [Novosphingobium sp. P6W]AXB79597.1 hypothetical protein TQ38_024440 [Novosphingobium sp. P6W]KIS34333.1 hypothetical protein TQ38_01580 [Novosphingobium sp. P6W]